jgi:antitoxin ParD1/3/4
MNVSLTPELEQFVADKVATGRFTSASEVVRSALRTLEEEDRWKAYARDRIQRGLDDQAAGRTMTSEQFLARIEARKRKTA